MTDNESVKSKIYELMDKSVKNCRPNAVLLSGGVDSSIISMLGKKYNPDLKCITVITNEDSPDKQFASLVAKELGAEHIIATINQDEIESLINKVVLSLNCFNIYWVSAAIVLYKGLETAKELGIDNIATGEGSDDLFGSFPIMQNWQFGDESLIDFINRRMEDIDVMTERIAKSTGIKVALPYHDKELIEFTLSLPLSIRTLENPDGTKVTKYALRETFRGMLPEIVTYRPQTMAFTGASTLDTLIERYSKLYDMEKFRDEYKIDFISPFECHLFKILLDEGRYDPDESLHSCLYCRSKLRSENSVHCTTCGTLQYNNTILNF
ncbi:MAG: asparagine synthase C-terminal domain-containing protein [Candidatus Gracilibacteria bacterium]|nr:asparagine synthase C-terminal domain-containing protein [Candidatus Gracilibacteria bacterium]